MPILDFKEIPEAHTASGVQDSFEVFASEFLQLMGFKLIEGPSRGPDQGADLVVSERRAGVGGETEVRWLVSCKHRAHSGSAVGVNDEINIVDRLKGKNCQGFIAVYSTIPSSGLAQRLREFSREHEIQIYDSGRMEPLLLAENGEAFVCRYFPISFGKWRTEHPRRAEVFTEPATLECQVCRKDLLYPVPAGNLVFWEEVEESDQEGDRVVDVHWCCKTCDQIMANVVRKRHESTEIVDGWEDLSDLCIPVLYIRRTMSTLNGMQNGDVWSVEAFDKLKIALVAIFQHVARDATGVERERIDRLLDIPDYIGGLGRSS